MNELKKYKINALLEAMPIAKYNKAVDMLPSLLDISVPTFNNYRRIGISDSQDIPYATVAKLEAFFGIPAGTLANFEVDIKPFAQQYHDDMEAELLKKHNMTKS